MEYSFVCHDLDYYAVLSLKQPLQDIFLSYPIVVSHGIDLIESQEILPKILLDF